MNTTAETEDLARIALGRSAQRNTRIRRALIARLLNEDTNGEEPVEADAGDDSDADDEERQLVRALVGGRLLKRRRFRRMLKAKLLTERAEGEDSDEADDESGEDDGELARLLVGSRMFRRRRVRRACWPISSGTPPAARNPRKPTRTTKTEEIAKANSYAW
jgi:hypothetical protein